ncbi:uncharacterized protein LOC123439174 [Hordeum vulgare subsp. vulgare]|uniref:uncharacterized protein LOC123439174 n=1 Tax=Hordeum vulgare subsp. vulgare TaxID=112509 RepID=UPI001D1A45C2|nr:uncharacterized protein LOC123439174 [Hordeum vulgare subsp. vulgare]
MKRNDDIKSFFLNYEAKTRKVAAQEQHKPDIDPPPLPPLHLDSEIDIDIYSPPVHSDLEIDIDIDDEAPRQPSPQHPNARSYNIQRLPTNPGERIPISEYDVGDQDKVRKRYIAKNAIQPYAHNFEVKKMRHDMLRDVRAQKVLEALEMGEIESGSGLNQEMGLSRPGDTRWVSHFKTIMHIVSICIPQFLRYLTPLEKILHKKVNGQEYMELLKPLNHLNLFSIFT